ncbi:MAG: hypothetical protein ACNI3C_04120 [Candidatus Marinarcus sp.]|uniref:hypothetical protein n=1 Tax=Candidatus Marinarcus sp. TaxID=3100987 RepID=UPI003AFFD8AB
MALDIADKVLIDFSMKRFYNNNVKNQTDNKMQGLADMAKELNQVFATKEREALVKKYAVIKLFLFNENILLQNYDLDFSKKEIRQKCDQVKVLDIREIYGELNESLKCIGSNMKVFKTT